MYWLKAIAKYSNHTSLKGSEFLGGIMRLDKFLKVSRIIKRRTVAKEACDKGIVTINGKLAKSSSEVKLGDVLEVTFGEKKMKFKITEIREHVLKAEAKEMYEIIE